MADARLSAEVRAHCKITWDDNETQELLDGIIGRAESMMNDLLGAELDYSVPGRDKDLFLNMCLYLYNGLTEVEFMESYGPSLSIARQFHVDPINTEETNEDQ